MVSIIGIIADAGDDQVLAGVTDDTASMIFWALGR
jgi:hypothetical protein